MMRIGVMLRAFDEKGGVGVYTRNIINELLRLDTANEYVLYYADPGNVGRFAGCGNVVEKWISARHKGMWDQLSIPLACRRDRIDVVFHPKFTAPLLAPCKVVMVVHGADWLLPEQARFYSRIDVMYMRLIMPLYIKKCASVISVSRLTTENFNRALGLTGHNGHKIKTVYFAPARHFKRVDDAEELKAVKAYYRLPEKFIFTLAKPGDGGRKNLGRIFKAYQQYHGRVHAPYKLVVGGKDGERLKSEWPLAGNVESDIVFPGWIEQKDLPAVYTLSALFLYPSNLEAFPIPITEALACGTPIVTSNVNGLEELAGDAAVRVDPKDTAAISSALMQLSVDEALRKTLSERGIERSKRFSWDVCAGETLAIIESCAGG
ncbi:MAG: glycosyltransferase family 1 protein [Desulfobacterales bacterium]